MARSSAQAAPIPVTVGWDARLVSGTNTGDSTHWTSLLDALRLIEDDTRFVLLSNAPPPDGFVSGGRFEWRVVPARSSRWWSLAAFPIAARRSGADIVHVQYSLSPLVRSRAVTTVHDVSFLLGPEWFRTRDRILMSASVPAACRRADRVIAVSETCREEIERLIPAARGKVRVVNNACPAWIQPVPRESAQAFVRDQLGVKEPFLLTVGTRWPRKNMALAVRAVDGLPSDDPRRLLVTGKTGWGEDELGKRGRATRYVDAPTLSALYSAADAYLAPSRHEGFGIPLLEAFRCGCPVICSTGGALPEVAGDAALIVRSWEASDWTAAIRGLLNDPGTLDNLRKRGRRREREFTWEEAARKLLAVYREVIA